MKKHQVKFTYEFGEKVMWALVFEKIDSDFAPYSFSAHDAGHIEEKKTEMPLELCDNGKKIRCNCVS